MADEKKEQKYKPAMGADVFFRNHHSVKIYPAKIVSVQSDQIVDLIVFRSDCSAACSVEKRAPYGIKSGNWSESLDILKAAVEYERNPIEIERPQV